MVLRKAIQEAAYTKEDSADLINVALEELVRQGFELPGFTTLQEAAQRGRARRSSLISPSLTALRRA